MHHPTQPEEFLTSIVSELAATLSVPTTEIAVERVERVTWPDGSLGCPEPGMLYPQMLVDGFRVLLRARGRQHDYRVGRSGSFRRCEQPAEGLVRPRDSSGQ